MSLADLGNLGEFLSALVVVISLLYLAVQIRQNSRLIRASGSQAAAQSALEFQYSADLGSRASSNFLGWPQRHHRVEHRGSRRVRDPPRVTLLHLPIEFLPA